MRPKCDFDHRRRLFPGLLTKNMSEKLKVLSLHYQSVILSALGCFSLTEEKSIGTVGWVDDLMVKVIVSYPVISHSVCPIQAAVMLAAGKTLHPTQEAPRHLS